MFTLIAVLFPSLLGLWLIDYLGKGISLKNAVYYFAFLTLCSSAINNVITYLVFNLDSNIVVYLNTLPVFFAKYVLISIVVNTVLALMLFMVTKNVSFKIEVDKNEEVKKSVKKSKNK